MNSGASRTAEKVIEAPVLKIYPNPATNEITVASNEELIAISIFDLAGSKVKVVDTKEINLNRISLNLDSGVYLLQVITAENKVIIQKVIVME